MKLHEKLEKAIDGVGLLIALIVDLIVIPICMVTIAPDFLTKIAFLCIGVTIVLFVFRSWAKGDKLAWLVFPSVVFFFDFSFAIVATQAQSHKVDTTKDAEVIRIDGLIATAEGQIIKLQSERTISTRPETIASISKDIETENAKIEGYKQDRKAREKEVKKTGGVYITADSVFTSIPDAWANKRYLPLFIFGLMFLGIQMVAVTSIDSPKKKEKKQIEEPPKAEEKPVPANVLTVADFVRFVYYGVKIKKPYMPLDSIMGEYCKIAGKPWDNDAKALYKKCYMALSKGGFIGENNKIDETKTEVEALEYLSKESV